MGNGTVVERVRSFSNGGPGIVVGIGSVIDSMTFLNGGTGIIALMVRGSSAEGNRSVGIFIRDNGRRSHRLHNDLAGSHGIGAYRARAAAIRRNAIAA